MNFYLGRYKNDLREKYMSSKKIIKNNIQKYRKFNNLTQEQLAQNLSLTRTYLSKLENEKFSPSPELMIKICKFFDVQLGDMFFIDS